MKSNKANKGTEHDFLNENATVKDLVFRTNELEDNNPEINIVSNNSIQQAMELWVVAIQNVKSFQRESEN